MKKSKPSFRKMRDIINILMIGVPEVEKRKRQKEYLNKSWSKNFPN